MKTTLRTIRDAEISLSKLLSQDLPLVFGFKMDEFVKTVKDKLDTYRKCQLDLAKKVGTKTDQGYTVAPKDLETFNAELDKLLDFEVELPNPNISWKELQKEENIKLSPIDVRNLTPFLGEVPGVKGETTK